MSKILQMKLENCSNYFTTEDLFTKSRLTDAESKICSKCVNHSKDENGNIVCNYKEKILKGNI